MLSQLGSGGGDDEIVKVLKAENERLGQSAAQERQDLEEQLSEKTMQVKMAAEIGQDLNDKNEELTHELGEIRAASRESVPAVLTCLRCLLPPRFLADDSSA